MSVGRSPVCNAAESGTSTVALLSQVTVAEQSGVTPCHRLWERRPQALTISQLQSLPLQKDTTRADAD